MWSLPKNAKKPRFWGATIVLSGIVLSKFSQLKEFWRFGGGNQDRMIPKQNAGFRIYVVYWSKFKNWVPTDIGLGLVLSIHVLGYL